MNHFEKGITVSNAKLLRAKLNELLATFKEEGISIQLGNCLVQNDGDGATFKLIIKKEGAESQEVKDLRLYADMYKIDTTKVASMGSVGKCMLTGFRAKARSKPWVITQIDMAGKPTGKSYIISQDQAKQFFGQGV